MSEMASTEGPQSCPLALPSSSQARGPSRGSTGLLEPPAATHDCTRLSKAAEGRPHSCTKAATAASMDACPLERTCNCRMEPSARVTFSRMGAMGEAVVGKGAEQTFQISNRSDLAP
jgi:hypothetical protein